MELRQYLRIAWRWAWLVALGALVGAALAFVVSRIQTPIYEASATVLINQAQTGSGPTYNDVLASQQLSKTYARLVTSGPVLEQVGQRFDLSYMRLRKIVSATSGRDTQLIEIDARHADPELAMAIANETARVFADQVREAQLGQRSAIESDLEAQLTAVQASIDTWQGTIARLSTASPGASDPQRSQQLAEATSQVETLRLNQASLQRRLQDLRIDLAKSINSVTLADPARVPDAPVSPRTLINIALGGLLGLLVVAGVVALAEYLDDTVKSAEDVQRVAQAPVLGAVPRLASRRRERPRLLSDPGERSMAAEAYRVVRTNLEFARHGGPNRTLLVTSALPDEGKSTTAANLALMLAESGRRVILVDADLRKRTLHQLFDVPNTTGLSTLFLMDDPQVESLLRPTAHENLRLLTGGPAPPNPSELLASARMHTIIERLTAVADVVIFDSAPLLSVADTVALAPALDGVVLVAEADRTKRAALAQAVETLARTGATCWGVVLNKLKTRRGAGYYYGYGERPDDSPPPSKLVPPSGVGTVVPPAASVVAAFDASLRSRGV